MDAAAKPDAPNAAQSEGSCELCGRTYRVWSAASPIWNATVRGGDISGAEEFAYLCADCFMSLAEDRKVATLFRVTAERTRPLDARLRDGRVWSDDHFQWINPPSTKRRVEADELLPFFSAEFEPLQSVARRAGGRKSACQLVSRARDLEARGLVESAWLTKYSLKVWRASRIEAQRAETTKIGSVHESLTAAGGDAQNTSEAS